MTLAKRLESWVFKNGKTNEGLLLHRFNDSHSFGGNTHRHSPPFDFVGILDTFPIAIECKTTTSKTFSRSLFNEKQIENLHDWERNGGISLFVIVIGKMISIVPLSDIPKKGSSLKPSNNKVIWVRLNLKELINGIMERQIHALKA